MELDMQKDSNGFQIFCKFAIYVSFYHNVSTIKFFEARFTFCEWEFIIYVPGGGSLPGFVLLLTTGGVLRSLKITESWNLGETIGVLNSPDFSPDFSINFFLLPSRSDFPRVQVSEPSEFLSEV